MSKFLDKVQPKNKKQLKQLIDYAFKHNIYDLNFIDTSKITDMTLLFSKCNYNIDISRWDMSNVRSMSYMFYHCKNFNCDLSNWDVSNVTTTFCMFAGCKKFNSDLSNWNMANVKTTGYMFIGCESFEGKGLENWDVSKVKDMHSMFYGCKKLNCDLSDWDVSFVSSDFGWTFYRCDKMTIPKWYMRIMNDAKYN